VVLFLAFFNEIGIFLALLDELNDFISSHVAQKLFAIYIKASYRVRTRYSHEQSFFLQIHDFFKTENVSLSNAPHSALNDFRAYLVHVFQPVLILHRQFDNIFNNEV